MQSEMIKTRELTQKEEGEGREEKRVKIGPAKRINNEAQSF